MQSDVWGKVRSEFFSFVFFIYLVINLFILVEEGRVGFGSFFCFNVFFSNI